jgi:UDP-galactopyranose mutase
MNGRSSMRVDVLIVGAGFSGAVVAERLASHGKTVLVIDRRPHIGGNEYDRVDAHGVLVHPYGPHIFHTNGMRIAEYLSQFTEWRFYEHRVRAKVGDLLLPIPINIDTVNRLYGLALNEQTIGSFYESVREPRATIRTSEDVVLNAVGRDLYERFFRGYTRKQWGLDPSQLAASVAARIPTRSNHDDRYFTDTFQHMPLEGYTRLFERMLDHRNIRVECGVDFFGIRRRIVASHIVYTGPIDAYFKYCYGKLPYRSIRFEHEHLAGAAQYQVTFVGRLAQYRYYNMDQCVGAALKAAENVLAKLGMEKVRPAEGSRPRVRAATAVASPPAEQPRHDVAPSLPSRTA